MLVLVTGTRVVRHRRRLTPVVVVERRFADVRDRICGRLQRWIKKGTVANLSDGPDHLVQGLRILLEGSVAGAASR